MIRMNVKEFMNRDYESWCVDGSENYIWLDVSLLVIFGFWVVGKI